MTEADFQTPLPIADEDHVYRQVHWSQLQKSFPDKKKKFPTAAHFKPNSDGLSVHLSKLTNVNGVYHVIGLSYKPETDQYKDYKAFKIFRLPVRFLRNIEGIQGVVHSPVFNGNPAPLGSPNNYAHASVLYAEDDEEVRLKLSTFCNENYDDCYQEADFKSIDEEVIALRARLQDTLYHILEG